MVCARPELASMSFAMIFRERRLELTAESSEVAALIVRTLQRGCGQHVDVDPPSTTAGKDRSSVTTVASSGEPRVWWDFSAANSKPVPRAVTFDLPPPLLEAPVPPPPPEEELGVEEAEEAEADASMPGLQLALFRLDLPTFGPAVPLVVPLPPDGSALLLGRATVGVNDPFVSRRVGEIRALKAVETPTASDSADDAAADEGADDTPKADGDEPVGDDEPQSIEPRAAAASEALPVVARFVPFNTERGAGSKRGRQLSASRLGLSEHTFELWFEREVRLAQHRA